MATPAAPRTASLRAELDAVLAALPQRLRTDRADRADLEAWDGSRACRMISAVYDQALAPRFHAAADGGRLALVATGAWARYELAPYSDIDFIVLHDGDEAAAKRVADALLYPLWDDKLAVGHSVHEPRVAARLARGDLATATALLDARHVAGDRTLSTELVRAALAVLAPGGNPNDLIATLAAEKKARHARFGASIYLLEPNLKQGIGALRDLATALWCACIRWHPPRPGEDPQPVEHRVAALVSMGHLNRRQAQVLLGARDFQLRVRALVQLAAKRRFDQLTFEIQEAIAPGLYPDARAHDGDVRPAVAPAVEALMRDYYLHARGVHDVSDRLLEAARVPPTRKPRIATIDSSFLTFNGELSIKDPRLFVERPSEMIRLFRVAVAERLPVYGHTRELAAETIARDPAPLAGDSLAARLLFEALIDVRDRDQPSALEVMNQLGILSAVMPEWAPCVGRVQHDLYHVYTVDQHQLYAVAMQKRIARGELAAEHPTATELWREVVRPGPLLLGTLLHDVGKPLGKGHAEKGAVVARQIAKRLGMSDDDADLAEFLVRQHLTMSHLSQRRDLTDPEVIARFAERIGSEERLVQLYLVTLCDTAMTAPDNLSAWKDGLLRDLFLRTRERFRSSDAARTGVDEGRPPLESGAIPTRASQDHDLRERIVQLAWDSAEVRGAPLERGVLADLVERFDERLLTQLTPRQAARHVKLVIEARAADPHVALLVRCFPLKGHSELAIAMPDRPGALATIAGTLSANRVDVLGAVLGSVDHAGVRLVTDVFYVRDLKGAAIPEDDPRWQRLSADLRRIVSGAEEPGAVAELISRRRPRSSLPKRVTPGVLTEIRIHDDSTQATIVEVFTRDRVGVLYAITQTLADLGLDILLAKISTEGEKVADVFYVTRGGKRIVDAGERQILVDRLRLAVDTSGLTGS